MRYYPVYLDLHERPCVVVGGGQVAERKVTTLMQAEAQVTVVSPSLTPVLQSLSSAGTITHKAKTFETNDIKGAGLVIAATDSEDLNSRIGRLCKDAGILVNVVSPPDESSFIVPSVVSRGDLLIAVSTAGSSPSLSRKIRQELEAAYGSEYEIFLKKMAWARKRLLEKVPHEALRRAVFQKLVYSDVLDLLRQGREQDADQRIDEIIAKISELK